MSTRSIIGAYLENRTTIAFAELPARVRRFRAATDVIIVKRHIIQ